MKFIVKIVMWIVVAWLSYMVYDSIAGKIAFEEETKSRRDVVIERLKDIRTAQLAYKNVFDRYADNFDSLFLFIRNDSFPVIKALGTVPDSITEEEAVTMGIVTRDTNYVSVRDSLFSTYYLIGHIAQFHIDSLKIIPYSEGKIFTIQAGEIEKGKMMVQVFELFASFGDIYNGLNLSHQFIDLKDGLRVGSMTEPSTSGNWGE